MSRHSHCDSCEAEIPATATYPVVFRAHGGEIVFDQDLDLVGEFCNEVCLANWALDQHQATAEAQASTQAAADQGSKQPVPKRRGMVQNPDSPEDRAP